MAGPFANVLLVLAIAFFIAISLAVYGRFTARIFFRGGNANVGKLGPPDLLVGSVLTIWFLTVVAGGFTEDPRPIKDSDLLRGPIIFGTVVLLIAWFLERRKINVIEL